MQDLCARKSLNDLWNTVTRLESKLVEKGILTQDEKVKIDLGEKYAQSLREG